VCVCTASAVATNEAGEAFLKIVPMAMGRRLQSLSLAAAMFRKTFDEMVVPHVTPVIAVTR
jgi:hypothetical protein